MENRKIIPTNFFNGTNKTKQKNYNPKRLNQIARENIETDDGKLSKDLAKQMTEPCYFTDRLLKAGFNNNFDSHHIKNKIIL